MPSGSKFYCPNCSAHLVTAITDLIPGTKLKVDDLQFIGREFQEGDKLVCYLCLCNFYNEFISLDVRCWNNEKTNR
jgi:hypothetical protein